jgi:hypothetical protein
MAPIIPQMTSTRVKANRTSERKGVIYSCLKHKYFQSEKGDKFLSQRLNNELFLSCLHK